MNLLKKILFIESPSKASTIKYILGNENVVIFSTRGHILELENSGPYNLGVELDNNFNTRYKPISLKENLIVTWKKFLEKNKNEIETVYLATDNDREGEGISKEIVECLNLANYNFAYKRIIFNEITPKAIKDSLINPTSLDENLIEAQKSRQVIDKMIGFCISPILKKSLKLYPFVSAGRIQSFVLKMIVDREKLINSKKGFEEFIILSKSDLIDKKIFFNNVSFSPSPFTTEILIYKSEEEAKKSPIFSVKDIFFFDKKEEDKFIFSKPPFTTSSLLLEAKQRLSFSISRTTSLAQKLYEGVSLDEKKIGLISYPRTDSVRINPVFSNSVYKYIEEKLGKEYCNFSPYWKKKEIDKKKIQDAHEAIRPTNLNYRPEDLKKYLSGEEYLLYKLIFERTISSFASPSKIKKIEYVFSSIDKKYFFSSVEKICLFPGFLSINLDFFNYYHGIIDKSNLDKVKELRIENSAKEWSLNKPYRYNEGTIVKELETSGIGRPSTYRTFTDILVKRKYVFLNNQSLFFPTELGIKVNSWIQEFFSHLINKDYTRYLEEELDEISSGKNNYKNFISKFWENFYNKISSFE